MKYFVVIFALIIGANAFDLPNKVVVAVPKQEGEILKIPALDLKIGESGIVTRENEKNEFVLANVIVTDIQNGVAEVALMPFTSIKQRYMPHPFGEVTQKDKMTFRILYNRALAITPNQHTFQAIVAQNEDIDFIHPDIFATFLAKEGKNMPDSEHTRAFCDRFNIGLVFIALKNNIDVLDCQSLVLIGRDSYVSQDSSTRAPFWTRISDETLDEMFDLDEMQEYFEYYKNFVGESVAISQSGAEVSFDKPGFDAQNVPLDSQNAQNNAQTFDESPDSENEPLDSENAQNDAQNEPPKEEYKKREKNGN